MSDPVKKLEKELADAGYGEALTTGETSRVLGCSQHTTRALIKDGTLTAIKLRAQHRVRRIDLAHFLRVSRSR